MRDLRYALRTLRRAPLFTGLAALTLALGIGATTAIFTVVNGVLLRPLPYPHADRIMSVSELNARGAKITFSDPDFEDLRDQTRSLAALAEVEGVRVVSVAGPSEPVRASFTEASRDFFRVMGVAPIRGRLFVPEEQRVGGRPAAVVSEGFWRRSLGGAPLGASTTLTIDNRVVTVVGVMPASLDYPVGADIWMPRELEERNPHRTGHNFRVVGRLRDGVSLAQARADANAVAHRLEQQYGDDTDMHGVALVPLRDWLVGDVKTPLLMLLGASAVLLLIAGANVVNLMLARMAAREGELALRLALGGTRARLVRQFVAEALVLAVGGGVLGVALAGGAVRALLALRPDNLPRVGDIHMSWAVLLFVLGVSVVAAIAMGLLTAWRSGRGALRDALAESQRTQAGTGGGNRIRRALVVAQMAAALVLLVGAGLLGRSFVKLLSVDPGFRTENALVLDLSLPYPADESAQRRTIQFYDDLIARLHSLPGVRDVGAVNAFPLGDGGAGDGTFLIVPSRDAPPDMASLSTLFKDRSRTGHAEYRLASTGYFHAMHIPLIRGRLFTDADGPDAPPVAVISQSLAERRWPHEDPIGTVIEYGNMDGDMRPFTIVGIVGDVRETSLAEPPSPTFYGSYRQRPSRGALNIVVQGAAVETPGAIATVRRIAREMRPDVPPRLRTVESLVSRSVADRRFTLLLIGVFGASALLLATFGVYGVISLLVTQRRPEIGVRIALGAQTGDVQRLVLREGMVLALAGVLLGAALALALTRSLGGLLYGVKPTDPLSFIAVAVVLVSVALVASLIPAQRASRIDPMRILRGG
ncbi:MAG TPA: ABC transporter permease [Gemmatimonadaceae bacterium]|nr:ABC transporter permease [Gemmatimonadaceae bacterium]